MTNSQGVIFTLDKKDTNGRRVKYSRFIGFRASRKGEKYGVIVKINEIEHTNKSLNT